MLSEKAERHVKVHFSPEVSEAVHAEAQARHTEPEKYLIGLALRDLAEAERRRRTKAAKARKPSK